MLNLGFSEGYFALIRVNLNTSTVPVEASVPQCACTSINNNSSSQQLLHKRLNLFSKHNTNFNVEFRFFSLGNLHTSHRKSGNQETGPCESPYFTFQMRSDSLCASPLGKKTRAGPCSNAESSCHRCLGEELGHLNYPEGELFLYFFPQIAKDLEQVSGIIQPKPFILHFTSSWFIYNSCYIE